MKPIQFCPQAVIFDMDGLLVDSEPVWADVEDAMLSARSVTLTHEVRQKYIGMRMTDFWRGLHDSYRLTEPVEHLITEAISSMVSRVGLEAAPRPGALELLTFITEQGIPCAIASSSPMPVINTVVEARGWGSIFTTRVSGDDVMHGKPAPDIYLEAARRLGASPEACLALEDSLNGTRAAVAAGMLTIAVPDLAHTTADAFHGVTEFIYPSLHEVRTALEECDFAHL